jgi:hypothetical protein
MCSGEFCFDEGCEFGFCFVGDVSVFFALCV